MNQKESIFLLEQYGKPIVGYSRAVRVGANVYVSGITATDEEGKIIGHNNPYLQTVKAIRNIEAALQRAGAALSAIITS
jgi:enamine deaminase RidA (YjgF/YER057c/UK114 family)